jgi:hypothetical protein
MKPFMATIASVSAVVLLSAAIPAMAAGDEEDWKAARKASCPELKEAWVNTRAAERKVAEEIKRANNGTAATNVLGATAFAFTGYFFFTWNDNESAEENLADLRHDLDIIKTVAAEKKCELPK